MSRKRLVDAGMDNGDCCSVDEGLTLLTVVFFSLRLHELSFTLIFAFFTLAVGKKIFFGESK